MTQNKCKHLNILPSGTCSFCNSSVPEKLFEICFNYINKDLMTMCEYYGYSGFLKLKEGVSLPVEICERFFNQPSNRLRTIDSTFVNIFKDTRNTRLKRVRLRKSSIYDNDLQVLLSHELVELEIAHNKGLTHNCLPHLTTYGDSLLSLTIGEDVDIFPKSIFNNLAGQNGQDCIFSAKNLRRFALHSCHALEPYFYVLLLRPMTNLTHLDLSDCTVLDDLKCIEHLKELRSLVLYNVYPLESMLPAICKSSNLTHLDISQSKEEYRNFEKPTLILSTLVRSLGHLTSLDISGTNLAGTGVAEKDSQGSDIPGLISRVNKPLHYLGLYETQHDACTRHDIPAKLIAGHSNEQQILIAAMAYRDRAEMLQKVLNELFHLFRFDTCQYVGQVLNVILESMNRHLHERNIQISGSATLFYIVKGSDKELHEAVHAKRRIISTLLDGMMIHQNDETMMRNGCLTLCQFKIPGDVLFEYERLVNVLLYSVHGMTAESFVQRIGIYLLNSLACQVDGHQKVRLGELGAIDKMIWLISERLDRGYCDDVLEVAWSTMWNVTDETPQNCRKFLENNGMEYFLSCLEKFPDKEELLRNMMGLLGNVAEVKELRHYLVTPEYVTVFAHLLDSKCDGIEVSYNAAGVIAHIASDGPEIWTVDRPSREEVLFKLSAAIRRWDLNTQRNINYRSFEPILHLVDIYHTLECQHWAVWALANLTKVYPEKYCQLLETEGGLVVLTKLLHSTGGPGAEVKFLAHIVVENCRKFKEHGWKGELEG